MNLLKETVDRLKANGKSGEDVLWVGVPGKFWGTWVNFRRASRRFNYDNGYGGEKVNTELKVVGEDWWLERTTYDGAEWWSFKTIPEKPEKLEKKITEYMMMEGYRYEDRD